MTSHRGIWKKRRSLNVYDEDDSSTSIGDSSGSSDMDINHMSAPNLIRESLYSTSTIYTPITKRRSFVPYRNGSRQAIGDAIVSPGHTRKERLRANPPVSPKLVVESMKKSLKKTGKSARSVLLKKELSPKAGWREELDLPANTTKEQAFAVLLCRELETMDI